MNYLKLFLPILIVVLFFLASEIFFIGYNPVLFVILKTTLLIYYLRLDNSGTPLINALTATLLCLGVSEYLLPLSPTMGEILFVLVNIVFAVVFAIRQRLKENRDKRMKLKMTVVFLFALTNITALGYSKMVIPVVIGFLLLTFVYFYDRLIRIRDAKNNAKSNLIG